MSKSRKTIDPNRFVCLELTPSVVRVVVCHRDPNVEKPRAHTVRWQNESTSLHSALGTSELTIALLNLVQHEDLRGLPAYAVLDGAYSVTRRFVGSEQAVAEQIDDLEKRCHRYLLLGHGKKVAARHIKPIDSGKCSGLLTVANLYTIESLSSAATAAGLQLESVGASAVVLAGLIDQLCPESTAGLLVRMREGGADLAIIDSGQLLLDVHPAQELSAAQLTTYINARFALLERFFARYRISGECTLNRILAIGENPLVEELTEKLTCTGLMIDTIDRRVAEMPWVPAGNAPISEFCAALGAGLGHWQGSRQIDQPDLRSTLQTTETQSLITQLASIAWPIAAAIIVCLGLQFMRVREVAHFDTLAAAVDEFEEYELQELDQLEAVDQLQQELRHLTSIQNQLTDTPYHELITKIANCLSGEAQLHSIVITGGNSLTMQGIAGSEAVVYDFVESINHLPKISNAALSGTRSSSATAEKRIEFDIHADLPHHVQVVNAEDEDPNA